MSRTSLSFALIGIAIGSILAACSKASEDEDRGQQLVVNVGAGGSADSSGVDTNGDGKADTTTNAGVDTNGDGKPDTIANAGDGQGGEIAISAENYSKVVASSCNLEVNEPETVPAKIMMVVDVSSSMKQTASGSTRNKWLETRDAIVEAFVGSDSGGGLPGTVSVGLLFYPNINTSPTTKPADVTACVKTDAMIPIKELGGNESGSQRATLRNALNGIQLGPQGTPTFDALRYGAEVGLLQGGKSLGGEPYVVLITDGMPTLSPDCTNPQGRISDVDPQPIVDLIDGLYKDSGVKTYLIGSPGSENGRTWMSRAAVLGHTAPADCDEEGPNWCHMDLTTQPNFGQALLEGLQTIAGDVVSCNYDIYATGADGSGAVDPMLTTVIARYGDGTRALVNRDDSPSDCTTGWYLDSGKKQVVLCSETCAKVQSDSKAGITVSYGCPTPVSSDGQILI
jgi:hypothetical protein